MKHLGATFAVVCLGALALPGCESAGHEKADTTAVQMESLRDSVTGVKDKSAAVAAAAQNLVDKADTDPKNAFAAFKGELKNYDAAVSNAAARHKDMKSKDVDFFKGWEQQTAAITDPDVKQRSIERRVKLQKSVEGIDKSVEAMINETTPYSALLKNLDLYWSNDLTPSGIKSVKDKVSDAKKSAKSIGDKCDDLIGAVDKAAPEFKTAKPPPPPADAGKAPATDKKN